MYFIPTVKLPLALSSFQICNTRIDVLEEDLRQLREENGEHNAKNKALEDALARLRLELSRANEQMVLMEEVKSNTAIQCNATKASLDSTQGQLSDLNDQVARLTYLLEEEKRKKRLAEERYTQQQEEYESVLGRRQKELETVSWTKVELEKSVATKEHELEMLRRQLEDASARLKELQGELSKVRSQYSTEINEIKLSYESQIQLSRTDVQRLAAQREEDTTELQLRYDRLEAERRDLEEEIRRLRLSISQVEEQKQRAEEEAHSQRAVITEEGRRRRELESQVEVLIRQRDQADQESSKYREDLGEALKELQEKNERLVYITHSLEEETRRRKTTEEGQAVLEQTVAQLKVKLTKSSMVATQLNDCEEELQKTRLDLEREIKERSRVEQNFIRLQGRIKEIQTVRDERESQVESLRQANQEDGARRRQLETELEIATKTITEYKSTISTLRQSLEQTSTSGKRGEDERLKLQEELERSLRQNNISAENTTKLSSELKALQQLLLQEQARVKEANLRNESLQKTMEEKSKTLNENATELERLKELTESQTRDRLKLEEVLRTAKQENEELLKSKQETDDELSSQITALQLQLETTERSNVEYHDLVSEFSSEREKLKREAERIQRQATEVHGSLPLSAGLFSVFQIKVLL